MKRFALKRSMLLLLMAFAVVSFGCHKKAAAPVAPAPPPPPPPPPPAPTVTLSSNVNAVTAGQGATLSYTSTNATNVTIQPGIGVVQPAGNGTRPVTPTATTTYTATATGPGGSASSGAVTIRVNPVPAPPPPPPPVVERPRPPATPNRTPAEIFASTMFPILFDYDKSTIRGDQESKLLNEAAYLKQNAGVRFTIEGHADERGSQEYNIALGDERAAAVKKFLAGQGVAEARMSTISYGEERPACRLQNEECWQMNRRAAFVMMP